jgi:hypothetical protein
MNESAGQGQRRFSQKDVNLEVFTKSTKLSSQSDFCTKYSHSSRSTTNKVPAMMNKILAANKYEKCSKMYFPLLSLMIEIIEAVTTMENSIAKYGQKLIEA